MKAKYVHISCFLLFSVLILYYPSLLDIFFHPSVFSIDDANLMNHILNYQLQMDEVFSPRGSGKYFRPFHELSYLIDQRLWGADVFGFRMTNLLIHVFNVVLVYLAVRLILNNNDRSEEIAALSAIILTQKAFFDKVNHISASRRINNAKDHRSRI